MSSGNSSDDLPPYSFPQTANGGQYVPCSSTTAIALCWYPISLESAMPPLHHFAPIRHRELDDEEHDEVHDLYGIVPPAGRNICTDSELNRPDGDWLAQPRIPYGYRCKWMQSNYGCERSPPIPLKWQPKVAESCAYLDHTPITAARARAHRLGDPDKAYPIVVVCLGLAVISSGATAIGRLNSEVSPLSTPNSRRPMHDVLRTHNVNVQHRHGSTKVHCVRTLCPGHARSPDTSKSFGTEVLSVRVAVPPAEATFLRNLPNRVVVHRQVPFHWQLFATPPPPPHAAPRPMSPPAPRITTSKDVQRDVPKSCVSCPEPPPPLRLVSKHGDPVRPLSDYVCCCQELETTWGTICSPSATHRTRPRPSMIHPTGAPGFRLRGGGRGVDRTEFGVRVTRGAQESVSVGFGGGRQLSLFGGGGGLARGLYRPPARPRS